MPLQESFIMSPRKGFLIILCGKPTKHMNKKIPLSNRFVQEPFANI